MLCLRILTAAVSLPLLVMTTSSADLVTAFRKLRFPKVATFMIVSALSFTTLIFRDVGTYHERPKTARL